MSVLRLLTFNVWGRTGPWAQRKAILIDELAGLRPDVIALQEVWDGDGGNLAAELVDVLHEVVGGRWHMHHAIATELAPERVSGNAILSRFPIIHAAHWALPQTPNDLGRGLVHAVVDTPHGRLPVFTTHLSWMFHHSPYRFAQVQAIAAHVTDAAPIGEDPDVLPAVLLGDFNAEPDADEIRYLRGLTASPGGVYFTDAFAAAGEGPGHTWHRANPFAARERSPNRRLDYVFVRGPDRWNRGEVVGARVVLDRGIDGVFASDHFGVLAEITTAPVELPPL